MTWAIDPKTSNTRFQLVILQDYKVAFLSDDVLQAFRNELFKPLSIPYTYVDLPSVSLLRWHYPNLHSHGEQKAIHKSVTSIAVQPFRILLPSLQDHDL